MTDSVYVWKEEITWFSVGLDMDVRGEIKKNLKVLGLKSSKIDAMY